MNSRNASLALASALLLGMVACGGSSASSNATQVAMPAPNISVPLQAYNPGGVAGGFDYSVVAKGQATALIAAWTNGKTATVDHGIGEIASGQPFGTPPLVDAETVFTLTVTGYDGQVATSKFTQKATDGPVFRMFKAIEDSATFTFPNSPVYAGAHYAPMGGPASWIHYEGQYDSGSLTAPDGATTGVYPSPFGPSFGGIDYTKAASGVFYAQDGSATPQAFDRKGTWTLTLTRNGITESRSITR